MQQVKGSSSTTIQDVPKDLIQHIQSLLPLDEAARTGLVSKSWLHAWSTNPTLRFTRPSKLDQDAYIKVINSTLQRYHRHNIPIVTFDLYFIASYSFANNWVREVASMSCLNELYLRLSPHGTTYTLPDELLSSKNLNTISVTSEPTDRPILQISSNTVIKCVNLRVLKLYRVRISEEVLDTVLSTCKLLEKIHLSDLKLRTVLIKVKNLRNLHSLKVESISHDDSLEVYQVPNLCSSTLGASSFVFSNSRLPSCNMDLLRTVTTLVLSGVSIMDDAVLNIIRSSFPFLLYLTLGMKRCELDVLDITCLSLKRLIIQLSGKKEIDIPIYAPKLLYFSYSGEAMPTLFINPTTSPPLQIELDLTFKSLKPIDHDPVFLKLREALNIPSKYNITITTSHHWVCDMQSNFRNRIPFPATNVEQLSFKTHIDKGHDGTSIYEWCIWVCRPNYVQVTVVNTDFTKYYTNLCWNRLISFMMEIKTKWPDLLKDVEIKHPVKHEWKTLTSCRPPMLYLYYKKRSFSVKFRLTWFSG